MRWLVYLTIPALIILLFLFAFLSSAVRHRSFRPPVSPPDESRPADPPHLG